MSDRISGGVVDEGASAKSRTWSGEDSSCLLSDSDWRRMLDSWRADRECKVSAVRICEGDILSYRSQVVDSIDQRRQNGESEEENDDALYP